MLPEDGAYSSLHTDKGYPLDIRDIKPKSRVKEEKADALRKEIEQAVADTQRALTHAYPNTLVMSQAQYDLLAGNPEFMQIGDVGQGFWLYRTKYNVMEIEVRGL
jgi:hypothetical protein